MIMGSIISFVGLLVMLLAVGYLLVLALLLEAKRWPWAGESRQPAFHSRFRDEMRSRQYGD
jgi:hypothetical protein